MKKKIAILGSTGSIGKNLINILKKKPDLFEIKLLSTNKNYKEILSQLKTLNVKNVIIKDKESFKKFLKIKPKKVKAYNDFKCFRKIFKKKVDCTMSAISGLAGLEPTLKIIEYTNHIAIANKEALICGWNLIKHKLNFHNVTFVPVDSEHFSIWYAINSLDNYDLIDKIYLTASGGPFVNFSKKKLNNVSVSDALKHPNWSMGDKISIDSATMINKVFELIEARNIFNLSLKKFSIIIHPDSYIHSLLKFQNGMIKIIAHDTTMKIPILNSMKLNNLIKLNSKKINLQKLNNLNLQKVNYSKFPIDKILNLIKNKTSLFDTILVTTNDKLVELFLSNKVKFTHIHKYLLDIINLKKFKIYKKLEPKTLSDIINVNNLVNNYIDKKFNIL